MCLTSSVAYIGPKSRTERPRNIKIGTDVAHITRDSDTTFKVKGQGQLEGGRAYCGDLPHSLLVDVSRSAHLPSRLTQRRARPYLFRACLGSKDSGIHWASVPKQQLEHCLCRGHRSHFKSRDGADVHAAANTVAGASGRSGIFRLDALALSVIATATWLAGRLGGCLSQPVLYQNDKRI